MDYSELPPIERAEGYRRLSAEALEMAGTVSGREATLYLGLAEKWLELADLLIKRELT